MPITPFHFGPGALAKSIAPRVFSFLAFVCTQVVIDLESLYNLWNHRWPVHRVLHSIPGSIAVGVLVAIALGMTGRHLGVLRRLVRPGSGELTRAGLLTGGVVGGLSHSLLDAIMHSDVRLLYPRGSSSPLYDVVGLASLHVSCLIAGAIGIAVLWLRHHRETRR